MTVYFAMLILSLVCMLVACMFMYLEIRRFGGFGTVPQRIAANERADVLVHHAIEDETRRGGDKETRRQGDSFENVSPCLLEFVSRGFACRFGLASA
jgi:hypothetical protein